MAKAFMAYPEYRHPFEKTPIHPRGGTTVLYQGKTIRLTQTGAGKSLLVDPEDVPRINGFELKPEGACLDELCVPLREALFTVQGGKRWFDLSAFAHLLGQACVFDSDARVWSFGEIPAKRERMMTEACAPEFAVKDRQGNWITKDSLKGKKAMIVTWASW